MAALRAEGRAQGTLDNYATAQRLYVANLSAHLGRVPSLPALSVPRARLNRPAADRASLPALRRGHGRPRARQRALLRDGAQDLVEVPGARGLLPQGRP